MKKLITLLAALLLALPTFPACAEGVEYILQEADIALTLPESFTVVPDDNSLTYLHAVDEASGTELVIQHGPDSKKNEDILLRKLRDESNGHTVLSEDMPIGRNRWFIYQYGGWHFLLVTEEGYGVLGHYYPRTVPEEFPAELEGILASVRILSQGESVAAAGVTFTMPADFTAQALSPQSDFLYKAQNTSGAVFGVLAPYDAARQEAWLTRLRSNDSGYICIENLCIGDQVYLVYHSATATSWNFWLQTPEGYGAWFAYNDGAWQEAIPQTALDILSTVQPAGE